MATSVSKAGRPAHLTIRQAAWLLAVPTDTVRRAVRVGTLRTTRRRSRLIVSTADVVRLLGGAR